MRRWRWQVLGLCLLAPAGAGLLRKLMPGQPVFLEIAGIGAVLLGAAWAYTHRRKLPGWVVVPLLTWGYFQLLYAALAVAENWKVGAAATMVRIAPMLMAPIAYTALRSGRDFRRVAEWLGILAAVLLPAGLLVALFGNEAMPFWLQPIERMAQLGKSVRAGVPVVAGIFSTQNVLSMSMLAVVYTSLAGAALLDAERRSPVKWWLMATAALALVLLSTRRGAFLAGVIGVGVYVVTRHKVPMKLVVAGVVAVSLAIILDQAGTLANRTGMSRGELLLNALDMGYQVRFRIAIFALVFFRWLGAAPFGTFLGYAGPEGKALAGRPALFSDFDSAVVEVGGAQLLLETGIAGALLMPAVVLVLVWQARRRSRGLRCRRAVTILLVFQILFFLLYYLKEMSAMNGVSMAQLFFWAVPGIAAALIERERKERRYWKAVIGSYRRAQGLKTSHGGP